VVVEGFANFDYGLSAEQEARAARVHAETIVIDMFFQGPVSYLSYSESWLAEVERRRRDLGFLSPGNDGESCYPWVCVSQDEPVRAALRGDETFRTNWEASGVVGANRQLGASGMVGGKGRFGPELMDLGAWAVAQLQFDAFPWLRKGLRAADFREAKAAQQRVGYLTAQDTLGLDPHLRDLQFLHDFGLRVIGLVFNTQNAVGSGCTERTDTGLSNFGVKVVARLNDLGIIMDVGHTSLQATIDACTFSRHPVVSTHTVAHAVFPHPRAKSDEELRAIADGGGVIGIAAVPFFLGVGDANGEGVTIERMLDHIDYVAQLVGWQHIGIGTDWPIQADKATQAAWTATSHEQGIRPEYNLNTADLVGLRDYRDFPNITRGMIARGYPDEQIKGILGENFLRVFEQVCG
jgi:membrane dipeptidase